MKSNIKALGRLLLIGILAVAICIGMMTVTALIPRDAIWEKSKESAEYFANKDSFEMIEWLGGTYNTMQDNYSDTFLFHIIYYVDSKNPLKSALAARYYQPDSVNIYEDYLEAVTTTPTPEPNAEYSRYWHGPMVYLRPLLLFLNASQIRILHGVLIFLGLSVCSIIMWKRGLRSEGVILLLSLVLVEAWMLFASLEYSTMFLWMTIFCLVVLIRAPKVNIDGWSSFFLVAGIVTAFVDFLTTETLSLTMPLLLILLLYENKEKAFKGVKKYLLFLRYVITWGAGYAGMFSIKWLLVYLVMGGSVFKDSMDEGLLRFGGNVYLGNSNMFEQATLRQQLEGSVWHNLAMLYPFANRLSFYSTMLAFGLTVLLIFSLVYLFHNKIDWEFYGLMGLIALIPIARFVLLSNHAYIHFFITYRALLPMVMGALILLWEHGIPHKQKKK